VLLSNLLEYMGIERDRLHMSWVSSAEATKFIDVVTEVTEAVRALGPNKYFIKEQAKAKVA
jgi:F420-non-reducing hydrogenase iron-sulfur subunit